MGQELVFGITLSPDQSFFMGPASRNPDGIAHASVTEIGERTFLVGFEDQFGGGDRDYDDTVFQFTGNLAPSTGDPAPSLDPLPVQDPSSPTPDAQADVSALTLEEARRRLRRVLRENYGRRYTRRQGRLAKSCSRLSSVKVRCRVRWKTRRHRYWGRVTLWVDEARPGSMLFTTSIRRTPRGLAARR
jgi:hypothetical protein